MASTSQSGQIRNSSSPSVIALGCAKAPSAATAKPRFRSRTGCWTCRRRKVKCDERGRNPETVAYGGPLSSSSGCKRCEDSGRPCHGYGAQAPSGPLITQYPPNNLHADAFINPTPFYSFSPHHVLENVSLPATMPNLVGNLEPASCPIPSSIQWTQPYDQRLPENQLVNYNLRMTGNPQSSSGPPSLSLRASPLEAMQQLSIQLPSVDLRRCSVPTYPTWQRAPQPRNLGPYLPGSIVGDSLSIDETSPACDNIEGEVLPHGNSSPLSTRHHSTSHAGDCSAISNDQSRKSTLLNVSSHYKQELADGDKSALPFVFGRPHTSSGVNLGYEDTQTPRSHLKTYESPVITNSNELECAEESHFAPSIEDSSPLSHPEVDRNVWPEQQPSSNSLTTFRPMSATITDHSVSSAQLPLFSAQVDEPPKCPAQQNYKPACATDVPIFSSTHDIPYDTYAVNTALCPSLTKPSFGGTMMYAHTRTAGTFSEGEAYL